MKHSTQFLLSGGLLAAVGLLTSFNPQSIWIAKHDSGLVLNERHFASTSLPNRIDLGDHAQDLGNFSVSVSWSQDKKRASMIVNKDNTQGTICTECVAISDFTAANLDLDDVAHLTSILAQHAVNEIRAKNAARTSTTTKATAATPKDKSPDKFESECEMEIEDGLLTCEKDELMAAIELCDGLSVKSERNTCYKKVDRFFTSHLRRSLNKGLGASVQSELYIEASEIRDDLIRDLPSRFDRSIRSQLLTSTADGVRDRLNQNYSLALMTGATPGYAATWAKSQMANEINFQNRFSVGGQLLSSLVEYSEDSKSLDLTSANALFFQTFYNPLQKLWLEDHSKGLELAHPAMPTQDIYTTPTVTSTSQVQAQPRVVAPGLQIPDGAAYRRSNSNSSRTSNVTSGRIVTP